jgi:hypothetical protein
MKARNAQFEYLQNIEDLCMQYAVGHLPDYDK